MEPPCNLMGTDRLEPSRGNERMSYACSYFLGTRLATRHSCAKSFGSPESSRKERMLLELLLYFMFFFTGS